MVCFLLVSNKNSLRISLLSYTCHAPRPFLPDGLYHPKESPVHLLQLSPYTNLLTHLPSRRTWQCETNCVLCLDIMGWRRADLSTITDVTQNLRPLFRADVNTENLFSSKLWQKPVSLNCSNFQTPPSKPSIPCKCQISQYRHVGEERIGF